MLSITLRTSPSSSPPPSPLPHSHSLSPPLSLSLLFSSPSPTSISHSWFLTSDQYFWLHLWMLTLSVMRSSSTSPLTLSLFPAVFQILNTADLLFLSWIYIWKKWVSKGTCHKGDGNACSADVGHMGTVIPWYGHNEYSWVRDRTRPSCGGLLGFKVYALEWGREPVCVIMSSIVFQMLKWMVFWGSPFSALSNSKYLHGACQWPVTLFASLGGIVNYEAILAQKALIIMVYLSKLFLVLWSVAFPGGLGDGAHEVLRRWVHYWQAAVSGREGSERRTGG